MRRVAAGLAISILILVLLVSGCGGGGSAGTADAPVPTPGGGTASLVAVAVQPAVQNLAAGSSIQLTATAVYSDGASRDVSVSATWSSSDPTVATVSAAGLLNAVTVGSATITATLNGISGSMSLTVTKKIVEVDSPFGFHPAAVTNPGYAGSGFGDAVNIGVKWAREGVYAYWFLIQPDLNKPDYDFSLHDRQWKNVPAGIHILANIAPQGPNDEGRCLPGSYLPVDTARYIAFVKATVDRYNGDGKNDMPGLTNPIKHWQVGNEPSSSLASGFAELQKMTYAAIKEVCPDCTVLIGGATGMPPVSQYLAGFDREYKPILDALKGSSVDVMDFHWYGNATGDYRGAKDVYNHIRTVLDAAGFKPMPVWIAEMGSYSGDPAAPRPNTTDFPAQTERQQALDYLKRFVYPLSQGVRKVFPAFGLMEGLKHDGGYFDYTGIIYDGWGSGDLGLGVRKLAYYTYKKMTETLEGADWGSVQIVQDADNAFICRITKDGSPVYVAWWDYFNEPSFAPGNSRQLTITGIPYGRVTVTEALPVASTGREVTDYAKAFRTTDMATASGAVTITLQDSPVLITPAR